MARKSLTERSCIFFLIPLLIGCALVAAVAVHLVHWLMRGLLSGPVGDYWYAYLAVAVVVAAGIALVRRIMHRHDAAPQQGSAQAYDVARDVAHISH